MVAFALRADGWYLRSDIVWAKPNPMPESVTDRPTKAHEYIFLLTKSAKYFYDATAIMETVAQDKRPQRVRVDELFREHGLTDQHLAAIRACGISDTGKALITTNGAGKNDLQVQALATEAQLVLGGYYREFLIPSGRNKRSVWTVTTQSYPEAHFATFPEKLIEPCILAGTSEHGQCATCGAPWERVIEKGAPDLAHQQACGGDANDEYDGEATKDYALGGAQDPSATKARILAGMRERITTGWIPTCGCVDAGEPVPQVVLDPFNGSGTTGAVAVKYGRSYIGIELNPDYVEMARRRIRGASSLFSQEISG